MFRVVFYILLLVIDISITSVGEESADFSASFLVIMWFLFGGVSFFSWCLGWDALLYCGTPSAFHIIILLAGSQVSDCCPKDYMFVCI